MISYYLIYRPPSIKMSDTQTNKRFRKYGSILNADSFDGREIIEAYGELEAVAMEKAHGAHFAFVTDGTSVYCAKRTSILTPEDKFYDHQGVLARFEDRIREVWSIVQSDVPDLTHLQVEGELIGGLYSHPDVEKIDGPHVQRGVHYSPNYEFYAYDIYYEIQSEGSDKMDEYLNYDRVCHIFETVGLLYAKPVARGTFAALCNYDNAFESVIPAELGLPEIKNNIVEGIVIKPVDHYITPRGSRIILKSKNSKFQETQKPKKSKNKPSAASQIDPDVAAALDSMVTAARLDNVVSKIGEVSMSDFGTMMKDLNQDILKDFPTDYPEIHAGIEKKDWSTIKKYLNRRCSALIKGYFATH